MTGMPGASGGTGATGPQGSAGQIELVLCKKITKTVTTHGHKHEVSVRKCTTRLVSGVLKFTTVANDLRASVARAGVVYATGLAVRTGPGRWQLLLTHNARTLRPGRYALTLSSLHARARIVQRRTITIT
jgi:hypothetical protein